MKDVTLEVLKDIRAELGSVRKELREELGSVREELAGFRRDVDQRFHEVDQRLEVSGRRQTATEVRLATEMVAVVGAIHELRDVLVADRAVRERVSDHEVRLQRLEGRT